MCNMQQRIQGPVEGRYDGVLITAQPFRGELKGDFRGELDGIFRGRGEVQTSMGEERIQGERHLRGRVEGHIEGEFAGEFRMEFAGEIYGDMDGVIEPL